MSESVVLKTEGLDKLIKALKGRPPNGRIGILGDKNYRGGKVNSNAIVGAAHEYGTSKLPIRSFLRVPLSEFLGQRLEAYGAVDKEAFKEVLKVGSFVPWMKKVMVLAEGVVADAFDTNGFGAWKPSNMAHKKNQQTLVETQQLRNSITSEVLE